MEDNRMLPSSMNIRRAQLIYFSPTRTTPKILQAISQGLQFETVEAIDLTLPETKLQESTSIQDALVVLGAPVYSGRIPVQAADRMRRFRGLQTPVVLVVVYGNRAYEDALLELRDIAVAAGFSPVAGAAFIGEHSFSDPATPIAVGRPDESDLEKAKKFGERIRKKLAAMERSNAFGSLQVPGNYPYRERKLREPVSPVTRQNVCTTCGTCAAVCPTGAITVGDTVVTDPTACIFCFACVKNCPAGARHMEDPEIRDAAKRLSETCRARKEPEMFGIE